MEGAGRQGLFSFLFSCLFVIAKRQDCLICVSLNPIGMTIEKKKSQSISQSGRKRGWPRKQRVGFLTKHGTREKRAFAKSSKKVFKSVYVQSNHMSSNTF